MDIKRIALISLGIIFTCYFTACRKITGCVSERNSNEYIVELPVSLYPAKDTFDIGDTLWIEQEFPDHLKDLKNGLTLDFSSFNYNGTLGISDLIDYQNYQIHQDVIQHTGQINGTGIGGGAIAFEYVHENGVFKHKMAIVMKKRGLFNISIYRVGTSDVDFTRCQVEYLDLRYITNNKAGNNFYMNKSSKDPFYLNMNKEKFDNLGCFNFYVR